MLFLLLPLLFLTNNFVGAAPKIDAPVTRAAKRQRLEQDLQGLEIINIRNTREFKQLISDLEDPESCLIYEFIYNVFLSKNIKIDKTRFSIIGDLIKKKLNYNKSLEYKKFSGYKDSHFDPTTRAIFNQSQRKEADKGFSVLIEHLNKCNKEKSSDINTMFSFAKNSKIPEFISSFQDLNLALKNAEDSIIKSFIRSQNLDPKIHKNVINLINDELIKATKKCLKRFNPQLSADELKKLTDALGVESMAIINQVSTLINKAQKESIPEDEIYTFLVVKLGEDLAKQNLDGINNYLSEKKVLNQTLSSSRIGEVANIIKYFCELYT